MTLAWVGTNGLFTRMGKIGKMLKDVNYWENVTCLTDLTNIYAQYQTEPDLIAPLQSGGNGFRLAAAAPLSTCQQLAVATMNRMVFEDNPQFSRTDLATSLKEIIRQMQVTSQTVQQCVITATPQAFIGNVGNGILVATVKRGDGLVQENTFAEIADVTCTVDSQSGALPGNEQFQFAGEVAQPDPFHYEWALGSGGSANLTAVNASLSNAGGNLLRNSDFETFTSPNIPDGWQVATGAPGTQVKQSLSQYYAGLSSLQFVGDSATNTAVTQHFQDAAGTITILNPDFVYLLALWIKLDVIPAAGVLTIELLGNGDAVTLDDQGIANSFSVNLPTASTSWASYSMAFRTPKLLATSSKIRVRLSTPLSTGSNLFIDHLAMAQATSCYQAGPLIAVFSGSMPFLKGDAYTLNVTNSRGGASQEATFQTVFDRYLNMRQLGLLLPSSASPSISDSLIS
jgi:hypothetical protein